MTRTSLLALILGCVITGWMLEPVIAGKGNGKGKGGDGAAPILGAAEAADLLFTREEEKLAHDVYVVLYAEWGSKVFDAILNRLGLLS